MCTLISPFLNMYCPFGFIKGPDFFCSCRCLLLASHHAFVLTQHQLSRLQITSLDTEPREGIIIFLARKLNTEIFYSLTLFSLQMHHYLTEAPGSDCCPGGFSSGGDKLRTSDMEAVSVQICCWQQKVCSVRACVSAHPNQISMEAWVRRSPW